jgi:hypothetical protein
MVGLYLWASAILYAGFGAWCTLAPERTARAAGYEVLSAGGRSEYLVVYGGLQFGLAICFAWLAAHEMHRLGLGFALALTTPIVLFRAVTVVRNWPVGTTTVALAGLEFALLAAAVLCWWLRPPAA